MCAQKLSFDYAHTLHTVRIVHNAHSVHRSRVQKGKSCDCINFVRATDPPYNTGNDFVYEDDFAQSTDEYLANSGQFDADGNRMVQNTESNGRFHTNWLNMIYPRLKIAKDLLSEQGVLVISIDDNEIENMRKCCNEIFGEDNLINCFIWNCSTAGGIRPKFATTDV